MKKLSVLWKKILIGLCVWMTVTAAWAVPPLKYTLEPVDFVGVPLFDCRAFGMDFLALADWTLNEYGKIHFDQDGNWVTAKGFTFHTDARGYNSEDPSKVIESDDVGGVGTHNHYIAYYDENQVAIFYKESGIYFKVIIPGYGAVAVNAGAAESVFDGNTWILTKFTPNRFPSVDDAYAVCSFLQ